MISVEVVILAVILAVGQGSAARLRRTAGGVHVSITDMPCEVSIRIDGYHGCGGALISASHVLTAAHCVVDDTGAPYKNVAVEAGTHELTNGGIVHRVKTVAWHSKYDGSDPTGVFPHDIAVLTEVKKLPCQFDLGYNCQAHVKLSEPIKSNDKQKPLQLPSKDLKSKKSGVFGGFGGGEHEHTIFRLACIPVDIFPIEECQKVFHPFELHKNQICASSPAGGKLTAGDSGGPLISEGKIVGVASWIDNKGRGFPDVYINVYKYLKFIEQAMKGKIVSYTYAPK